MANVKISAKITVSRKVLRFREKPLRRLSGGQAQRKTNLSQSGKDQRNCCLNKGKASESATADERLSIQTNQKATSNRNGPISEHQQGDQG